MTCATRSPSQWIRLRGLQQINQWDQNKQIYVPECDEVHFSLRYGHECLVMIPSEVDDAWITTIPNQLLKKHGTLLVWALKDETAIATASFEIKYKPKPSDYIDDPTDVVNIIEMITKLDARVTALENGESGTRGAGGLPALIGSVSVSHTDADSYADVSLADADTNTWDIALYLNYEVGTLDSSQVKQLVDDRMDEYTYDIDDNGHLIQTRPE